MTLGIAGFLGIVSGTSKTILRKISKYERRVNIENETKSRIIKMTLLNTINVGLLLSLNSINFDYYGAQADKVGDL